MASKAKVIKLKGGKRDYPEPCTPVMPHTTVTFNSGVVLEGDGYLSAHVNSNGTVTVYNGNDTITYDSDGNALITVTTTYPKPKKGKK